MAEIVTFGPWLKRARRQQDLTQKELAFHCGCSVGTIRKIEADERKPSRQLARLLAEQLDIPPEKQDAFVAFARSEPHIDHISFPSINPAVAELNIPAVVLQESFGDLVQSERNRLGLNRKELAELVGCSPMTIRQIERNEAQPSLNLAERLAVRLEIPEAQYEQFISAARGEFLPRIGLLNEMSLEEGQAPAAEEEVPKHNLPLQTTPFFGRQRELADIETQLCDPNCRLLTILAAGGMGKTRLSIEAAAAQVGNFTDGVTYVELAQVSIDDKGEGINPLAAALAEALNCPLHGSDSLDQQLIRFLRRREMLLVLDNFEHLLDTAELVGNLLLNAPDIKFLVTSRERLNLQEEWLFVLHGLSSEEATNSEAVQLFAQKARQVQPSFDLEAELNDVLRICRLVDGMPLALELAAAWVLQLSCSEIAQEIESEIDFLTTRSRNIPERHRSMRSVFVTSWERLSRKEKDVLQKSSVFRSGFDREAAQAVTGASLLILSDLVSKSFLSVTENGRYTIHELLRQYVAEKLAEHGSLAQKVQAIHGRYFCSFLAERNPDEPSETLEVRQNIDNVRAAIRWAAQHEPHSLYLSLAQILMLFEIDGWNIEAETTFRLIVDQLLPDCIDPPDLEDKEVQQSCLRVATYQLALCSFQQRQYRMQEAEESGKLALQWLPVVDELDFQEVRGETIMTLGLIKWGQGALVQALTYCQQAGELYQAAGDQIGLGWALFFQNNLLQHTGEFDTAEEYQKSVQHIAAKMDAPDLAILKWNELGKLATIRGQLDEAEAYFDKSLEQFAAATNPAEEVTYVLRERGEVSRLKGDYAQAKNYGQRSLVFAEDINLPHAISLSLWFLGNVAVDEGHFETALHYFAKFEQISTPLQEQIGGPGWAFLGLGRLEEAREQFSITLQKMIDNQARPVGLDALVGMAHIKARTGQLEEVLALLTLVKDHRSSHFESREKARKLRKELAAQLPSKLINEAESKGRKMDLVQTAVSLLAEVEATV